MDRNIDKNDIQSALQTLRNGGLILYPTDTIWGIGCDATNSEAVEKVFALKGRENGKQMIILLNNENQLASYVNDIPEVAYQLIEFSDRPLTIVYSSAKNIASNVMAEDGSVGIRIVNHDYCNALLQRFRKPIISTSANISNIPHPHGFDEIDPIIKEGVDYVVQYGRNENNSGSVSTIMKVEPDGRFKFIRK